MLNHDSYTHRQFYESTIRRIQSALDIPDDLCFVYVQHAFSPCIEHLTCVEERLAAIIPKGSSSKGNPQVVQRLQQLFPGRVLSHVTRTHLTDSAYAVQLLKDVTRGRPFAILEYGGYFAPAAARIAADRYLGPKLAGFVEGTENGIKGSDDGKTPGYLQVAAEVSRPILSKARSDIKHIMDLEIGPAIVESTDTLLRDALGCRLAHWRGNIGVIGLGSIGQGVLTALGKYNLTPMLHDTNTAVMAEMAYRQFNVAAQATVLANSDILFLNTGSCFLSQQPELLTLLKDHTILVLCTSGEIEAGIPQLINAGELQQKQQTGDNRLALYRTKSGKQIRVLLGGDQIGQAPNMVVEDGSGSPANLMSDMEFYAAGAYLASSRHSFQPGTIQESPAMLQQLIMEEWLQVFYPHALDTISPSHARPSATSPTTNTADTPL